MAMHKNMGLVFVLDLDDTLYKEEDYHASGMNEVCRWINSVYKINVTSELEGIRSSGEKDIFAGLCRAVGLPSSVKDSLLWVYRLHHPAISLSEETKVFLEKIKRIGKLAILTDGRSMSQRLKLLALGLNELPCYISEEYASEKPEVLRFERIMTDISGENYFYIGDNLKKDFIAPNRLGWTTVCLRDDGRNIHTQRISMLQEDQKPDFWINTLHEIFDLEVLKS